MSNYAKTTSVSPEKSQEEIKRTLRRYGADRFGVMEERTKGHVMFEYNGLMIQLSVNFPEKKDFEKTETGKKRIDSAVESALNQAIRQRWRALTIAIKAKLEAIECGISTIEQEFMAFVMMPDGRPLGEHVVPKLHELAQGGDMPKMLTTGNT